MTFASFAELSLAVAFAASVQTAVGFGFGLVLVPILLAFGRTLPEAVSISLGAGVVQTVLGLRSVASEVRWRPAIRLAIAQWIALPLGVWAMVALHDAGPERVKQGVGVVLLVVLTMRLVARPARRDDLPRGWSIAAGAISGVLSGAVGMGGPPLVLLALSQRFSADRFRAFLWEQFLLVTPVQLLVLSIRFGTEPIRAFGLGVALAPGLYLGTRLGRSASSRWDAEWLSRSAIALLYLLALASLLAPFIASRSE